MDNVSAMRFDAVSPARVDHPCNSTSGTPRVVRSRWSDVRVRCTPVPAWKAIEEAEPEFAERVQRLFDARSPPAFDGGVGAGNSVVVADLRERR